MLNLVFHDESSLCVGDLLRRLSIFIGCFNILALFFCSLWSMRAGLTKPAVVSFAVMGIVGVGLSGDDNSMKIPTEGPAPSKCSPS